MSYLVTIETAVPGFCHRQKDIASFFVNAAPDENTKRKLKFISERSGISERYSIINDFSPEEDKPVLFNKNPGHAIPSLTKRMDLYTHNAGELALKAIQKIKHIDGYLKDITHIITVSCTGLFAPGLDIELINRLNLRPETHRSSINFMGCNAAVLALKQADAICNSTQNSLVLVVCVELCTLHFQDNTIDDYILSNTLFADGAAAALVSSQPLTTGNQSIEITAFNSLIINKGKTDMAWKLSETGFIMNLTSYVSELINGNMEEFLKNIPVDKKAIHYWALHPGGKKIVDDFALALNLEQTQLKESYEVLKNYGNMSSSTVLFVLKQVIENNPEAKQGETIFSAAFGPGLSIETMQLQYV